MIEGLDRLPGPGGQPGRQAGEITRMIQGLDVPTPGAAPAPVGEVTRFIQGLDAAPVPAGGEPTLALRLLGGVDGGDQTLRVGPAGATLGRAPDNTIPIPDRQLSRYHARIEFANGAYWLTDLGTTNGTYVNRARLTAPHQLRADDVISLGETNLVVVP
jgi:pSer/pThr/pTyr-binding forkhead associated (FHA) protein